MREEGFTPCIAEPDIWMRPAGDVCECVAVCVDDLAFAMKDPATFAKTLEDKHNFKLKGTGELSFHLGANFVRDKDGTLTMSPTKCITERFVSSHVKMFGEKPSQKCLSPLEPGDHPELDDTEPLNEDGIQQHQSSMGSLQWIMSLGWHDMAFAVMSMSSFRVAPRKGHLERLKRIAGHVTKMKHFGVKFRVHEPDFSDLTTAQEDCFSVHGEVQEQLPDNAPLPLGKAVQLTLCVDANSLHDAITGGSVTACSHFANVTH